MQTLSETCVDSLNSLDVFSGDPKVMEVDLEFPFGEVFDLDVFVLVFVVDVVVHRDEALFVEGGASVEALASSEAPVLGFFFAAMWSCRNEQRVGVKTIGVRYPSGRRGITTARFDEGKASREK